MLYEVITLAEAGQHDRDLGLRNAGAGVLDRDVLAATGGPADLDGDGAAGRGELHRVGEQVGEYLDQALAVSLDDETVGVHARREDQPPLGRRVFDERDGVS